MPYGEKAIQKLGMLPNGHYPGSESTHQPWHCKCASMEHMASIIHNAIPERPFEVTRTAQLSTSSPPAGGRQAGGAAGAARGAGRRAARLCRVDAAAGLAAARRFGRRCLWQRLPARRHQRQRRQQQRRPARHPAEAAGGAARLLKAASAGDAARCLLYTLASLPARIPSLSAAGVTWPLRPPVSLDQFFQSTDTTPFVGWVSLLHILPAHRCSLALRFLSADPARGGLAIGTR